MTEADAQFRHTAGSRPGRGGAAVPLVERWTLEVSSGLREPQRGFQRDGGRRSLWSS